jgi:hypothetical protein
MKQQAQSRFATYTRNILELGISTGIPLTEYRLDVVSTRITADWIPDQMAMAYRSPECLSYRFSGR